MKKFIKLLLIVFFCSCVKEVEVDIPVQESTPVVSSIITPDSLIRVRLSETQQIFGLKDVRVAGATIRLFEDDVLLETGLIENGDYLSEVLPKINRTYQFKVDMSDGRTIFGKDVIPMMPILISASFEDQVDIDEEGNELSNVQILIRDDASKTNYYELILNSFFIEADTTSLEFNQGQPYFALKNDLVLENENILDYFYFETPVFSDNLFNGQDYVMNVKYYPATITLFDNNQTVFQSENHDLIITLRSVSKDYYTYKKRLLQHFENQSSDIWDGVGEPSPMFTNIKNGYGIFAGYSEVTDTIFK